MSTTYLLGKITQIFLPDVDEWSDYPKITLPREKEASKKRRREWRGGEERAGRRLV